MDNNHSCTDPHSESKDRPYKAGHFYDGNITVDAQARLEEEGTLGAAIDQGFIRRSAIPKVEMGNDGQDKDLKEQGTKAHFLG